MSDRVYRSYSRMELDREYDNQAKIKDYQAYVDFCRQASEAARAKLDGHMDIAYGDKSSEKLDIFLAAGVGAGPVEVYFHGGYWRRLDKSDFSYVAQGFGAEGVTSVIVNYGLIPSIDMGELIRQCARSVIWCFHNIGKFGGDPNRIYLSGHSAGAQIVAMLMTMDWSKLSHVLPDDLIKGATAISGIYDLEPVRHSFLQETLQLSERDASLFSPSLLRPLAKCPFLVAVGGDEGPEYLRQSQELVSSWRAHGFSSEMSILPGENHFSIRDQLGDPNSRMIKLMRDKIWRKTAAY